MWTFTHMLMKMLHLSTLKAYKNRQRTYTTKKSMDVLQRVQLNFSTHMDFSICSYVLRGTIRECTVSLHLVL